MALAFSRPSLSLIKIWSGQVKWGAGGSAMCTQIGLATSLAQDLFVAISGYIQLQEIPPPQGGNGRVGFKFELIKIKLIVSHLLIV